MNAMISARPLSPSENRSEDLRQRFHPFAHAALE